MPSRNRMLFSYQTVAREKHGESNIFENGIKTSIYNLKYFGII